MGHQVPSVAHSTTRGLSQPGSWLCAGTTKVLVDGFTAKSFVSELFVAGQGCCEVEEGEQRSGFGVLRGPRAPRPPGP